MRKTLPWWKTGLVIAGGWHPLNARIRARIPEADIEADYLWEYTDAYADRLHSLGINLVVTQYDRGLGDTDQAEHQALAKKMAAMCHKRGMYHGVYLANTVYYESMLKDHPDCEDWVVKTAAGHKTYYGGEQTWRWVGCLNAPGWRARQKRMIEKAIRFVNTDLLHFDNLGTSLSPDDCHCEYCRKAFLKYLSDKYPDPESQRRRFGFTGFETFQIPVFWNPYTQPWDIRRVENPLLQEWLLCRAFSVTDYIRDLAAYARELNPAICLDSNGQGIHGNNDGLSQGRGDKAAQIACVDIMCEENPDLRPDGEPGAIAPAARAFRSMLYARNLGKPFFTAYHNEEELAFNMAFAGDAGINTAWGYAEPGKDALKPHQPDVQTLLEHYKTHPRLYTDCRPATRIAVWRSCRSLLFVSTETHLSACVLEYTLFENRIPFTIISDGFIQPDKLTAYDLLILPDVEFIGDKQIRILHDYVRKGGNLLITERSGMYTEEPRLRNQSPFAPFFADRLISSSAKLKENIVIDESRQHSMRFDTGTAAFARCGRGRVAYLPQIDYVHKPLAFKSNYNKFYDGIDSRYWKQPHNTGEILAMLEWLNPGLRPVQVHGCRELRTECLRAGDGRYLVQMVRLGDLTCDIDVPLSVPTESAPRGARLYRPGYDPLHRLSWIKAGNRYETLLRGIGRHATLSFALT